MRVFEKQSDTEVENEIDQYDNARTGDLSSPDLGFRMTT